MRLRVITKVEGLILVEKRLGMHVLGMLKMGWGLYTGSNFK